MFKADRVGVVVAIGHRVRHFRLRQGMTQEELARVAQLTPKFISQIENGHVNPSIGVLEKLVDGMDLTFGIFFTWSPDEADLSVLVGLLTAQPPASRQRLLSAMVAMCDQADGVNPSPLRSSRSRATPSRRRAPP